jgi:hypothetical protein
VPGRRRMGPRSSRPSPEGLWIPQGTQGARHGSPWQNGPPITSQKGFRGAPEPAWNPPCGRAEAGQKPPPRQRPLTCTPEPCAAWRLKYLFVACLWTPRMLGACAGLPQCPGHHMVGLDLWFLACVWTTACPARLPWRPGDRLAV